jgi:hypothetical protein
MQVKHSEFQSKGSRETVLHYERLMVRTKATYLMGYEHVRGHNIIVSEDAAQSSASNSLDEEFSVGWCGVSQ